MKLEAYWNDIPIGKEFAATYSKLCDLWGTDERNARRILHELSGYDDGDDYILIRSSTGKGFYRTDDIAIISAYEHEILEKGKSIFAPLKKIRRVLKGNDDRQFSVINNLRATRIANNMTQTEVCRKINSFDTHFDKSLLSKMENGICLPPPIILYKLADIYGCPAEELVRYNYGIL